MSQDVTDTQTNSSNQLMLENALRSVYYENDAALSEIISGFRDVKITIKDIDIIEINEAFAAQGLASLRSLGIEDDDDRVNPNGGAIALGHPLGMSGTRLVLTATQELIEKNLKYALCTMCVGVGQGSAVIIEKV